MKIEAIKTVLESICTTCGYRISQKERIGCCSVKMCATREAHIELREIEKSEGGK